MKRDDLTPTEAMDDAENLEMFTLDITRDADVMIEQRDKANEDMRFVNVSGGMWEGFFDDTEQLDRVKLEFDLVGDFLNRFIGEYALNRIGVEYKPSDDKTTDDDAELLNGIYRADFRDYSGKVATDTAVDETATCGTGAFKLATVFEDPEDPENDNQRVEWRPIHNAYNAVYWDQAAQRIDKKDARHCTVLKEFTRDSFIDAYPGRDPVSAYVPQNRAFENLNTQASDIIYVATRYSVIRKNETIFVYNNLKTGDVETYSKEDHELIKDELKEDEFRAFVRERKIRRQTVEKTVFSGEDILEPTRRIAGKWIPVISVYGYRAYVDGVEWYRGLIRKLKDASRVFNMQMSQLAENAASNGQDVPIFDPDQMVNPDITAAWADKNNQPYLLASALRDNDGNVTHAGPLGYSKSGTLDQSMSTLMSIVPQYIQGATGGAPQDTLDPDVSGKAINALIKRESMTTYIINDHISTAFMWSGEVYQSIAAEIYGTQRVMKTLGRDGVDGEQLLHKTVLDSETGKIVETNTLQGKKFRAYADTGPQYESMREQTVEELKGMLEAFSKTPGGEQYTSVMLSVLLENITGVGLDPLKKLNRRLMLAQGIVKPETDEEQAMLQQLQQQAQQPDPQQELIAAASEQQRAEARSLDASSMQKVADAGKKEAETVQIISDIQLDERKMFMDAMKLVSDERKKVRESAIDMPFEEVG